MKKFRNLYCSILLSLTLTQPCTAILSETQQKMERFIALTSRSPVVSTERCIRMIRSYIPARPTRQQILELSEYFKYFIYTLYPRKLNFRDYNTLFSFFRQLEAFGLPESLHGSIYTALYNLPIT